jgi:hypothetical protein
MMLTFPDRRAPLSAAAEVVCPDRLRRAWALVQAGAVEQTGPRQFRVAGTVERAYDVDLDGDPICYCLDMDHRCYAKQAHCKHTLAARLAAKDPGLGALVAGWPDVRGEMTNTLRAPIRARIETDA